MDDKSNLKKRTMMYFIDAANIIIKEEGIEHVTLRKVAKTAGYNSATLYNYFENLDHLLIFASMKCLKEYSNLLPDYLKGKSNALDKYFAIWRCFINSSFRNPKVYNLIFLSHFSDSLNNIIKEYYDMFPEDLENSHYVENLFLEGSIYKRNTHILNSCASEGFINKEDIDDINEMTIFIYRSMLNDVSNNSLPYDLATAEEKLIRYFRQIIKSYTIK